MRASARAKSGGSNFLPDIAEKGHQKSAAVRAHLGVPLPQGLRLDAGLDAHGEGLGQRRLQNITAAIVHQFGNRAGSDGPDVIGLVAHRTQCRETALEGCFVAADPDCETAALGAVGAAADRCVKGLHLMLEEFFVHLANKRRRVGREIKVGLPGLQPFDEPTFAQGNGFDLAGPGSDVNMTSVWAATARGPSAHSAPATRCGRAASAFES